MKSNNCMPPHIYWTATLMFMPKIEDFFGQLFLTATLFFRLMSWVTLIFLLCYYQMISEHTVNLKWIIISSTSTSIIFIFFQIYYVKNFLSCTLKLIFLVLLLQKYEFTDCGITKRDCFSELLANVLMHYRRILYDK